MPFYHRLALFLITTISAFLFFSPQATLSADKNTKKKPPNILLIFADDVGREVLGCYGGKSYKTPNIDALSAGGMQFSHAYAMPVCHPSRVCLMSGQYPARLGNPKWGDYPVSAAPHTIAQTLRKAGYSTAVAGKWQLALMKNNPDHPQELGFDHSSVFGWHEGPRYHDPMIYQDGKVRKDSKGKYGPDLYVDYLVEFMKESRDKKKPFFALYSMALCHDVTDDIGKPVPFYKNKRWLSYTQMAESMDEMVGRITKAVDDLGLREETLILFTTDNGTANASYISVAPDGKFVRDPVYSSYQGRMIPGGKGTYVDWGTRVPLIANWPGIIKAGTKTDDLVDLSDYLPTLAEVAGAELPEGVTLDGTSFAQRLIQNKPTTREWAYVEMRGKQFAKNREFKLYGNGNFYDLRRDPNEEKSPLKSGELDEVQKTAKNKLEKVITDLPSPKLDPKFKSIFNGKNLDGWKGVAGAWEVHKGSIRCTGQTEGRKNWLIWQGDEPGDFELKLDFKFTAGNSGVQIRSHLKEAELPFQVQGYQVEIAAAEKMGLWHHSLSPEKYRSHLATAGQRVQINQEGESTVEQFAEPATFLTLCKDRKWNTLTVIARGPEIIQIINGVVFSELSDKDSKYGMRKGLIALQDHGKGTVAEFRKIRIRKLK